MGKKVKPKQTVREPLSPESASVTEASPTPNRPDPQAKKVFLNGLLSQNPILALFLGICSALAVSVSLIGALTMGLSTMAVLLCSNVVISLLRKYIPKDVRVICYMIISAGFVTIVGLCVNAFLPALAEPVGLFIPLIVVNATVLGHTESFAADQTPKYAALGGLSMGLGFTAALCVTGLVRECLGSGSILGYQFLPHPATLIAAPCGGLLVLGLLMALVQYFRGRPKKAAKQKEETPAADEKGGDDQ